jgi:hypothetical protein
MAGARRQCDASAAVTTAVWAGAEGGPGHTEARASVTVATQCMHSEGKAYCTSDRNAWCSRSQYLRSVTIHKTGEGYNTGQRGASRTCLGHGGALVQSVAEPAAAAAPPCAAQRLLVSVDAPFLSQRMMMTIHCWQDSF